VQGVPREFPVALENVLRLAIEMNATGRHVWVGLPPARRRYPPLPAAPMTSRPSRRVLLLALLVTAITVASLWPALDGQFLNWGENFLRNESYRELRSARLRWMVTTSLMGHYIPLTGSPSASTTR